MSDCEFKPGTSGLIVCKTSEVFQKLLAELEGALTVRELKAAICDHEDPEAREQCPAYNSLAQKKRSSWSK